MVEETMQPQGGESIVRRLATILCADVAGYSEKMGANEERTVQIFRGHREIFESLVNLHRGRIFNTAGDALLVEFNSAVEAVRCATEIQAALQTRNELLAPDERMLFRIGINLGDVIVQGQDLLGDGVNVAARIQTATEPGGICISGSVYDQIQNKLSLSFRPLGEQIYKNIAKPVRTYTITEVAAVTKPAKRASWRLPAAIAAAVVLIAVGAYWGYRQLDAKRAEQARIESQLAAQLTAQRQATEQAQRAAEDAKRDAEILSQKQAAEEVLRRAQEERSRLEQERKLLETEKQAAESAKRLAAEQARRAAEDAKRDAEILAQKQAAEEALRRAQEERNRLERERKLLETEKQAASQRTASEAAAPAVTAEPKSAVHYDGTYHGLMSNNPESKTPVYWPVVLSVRNGVAEGSWWQRKAGKSATVTGTVAADGTVELKLAALNRQGRPTGAVLVGRVTDDEITVSGRWGDGTPVSGEWKRTETATVVPAVTAAPKDAAHYDGTYGGELCNKPENKPPNCWPIVLSVRNGVAEASWWQKRIGKTATVTGTVAADGTVELKLAALGRQGKPAGAVLVGRVTGDEITASGRWGDGTPVSGNWKRAQ